MEYVIPTAWVLSSVAFGLHLILSDGAHIKLGLIVLVVTLTVFAVFRYLGV